MTQSFFDQANFSSSYKTNTMKQNVLAFTAAITAGQSTAYNFTTGEVYNDPKELIPFGNLHEAKYEDIASYPQHIEDAVKDFTKEKAQVLLDNEDRFVTAIFENDTLVLNVAERKATQAGQIPSGVGF